MISTVSATDFAPFAAKRASLRSQPSGMILQRNITHLEKFTIDCDAGIRVRHTTGTEDCAVPSGHRVGGFVVAQSEQVALHYRQNIL